MAELVLFILGAVHSGRRQAKPALVGQERGAHVLSTIIHGAPLTVGAWHHHSALGLRCRSASSTYCKYCKHHHSALGLCLSLHWMQPSLLFSVPG